ncbi:MAG: family 1 glycosylhydrolase [Pseudonocardiaceae bacterium]|nr:family 1 glycosylhydrolase [Pseudonocardiaceae bacterium]
MAPRPLARVPRPLHRPGEACANPVITRSAAGCRSVRTNVNILHVIAYRSVPNEKGRPVITSRISRRRALAGIAATFTLLPPFALFGPGATASARTRWSRSFYWGVAMSGYQSEGDAPDSNWSRYVARNEGNGEVDPYRDSVDFRHRYPEDLQRAADLGVNTFRFSVEWARVQPRPDEWDDAELAYYDDLLRRVELAGMTPMISLAHFVYPGWVLDQGGWTNRKTVDDWLAFSREIVRRYRDRGVLWVTFNEPIVFINHELTIGAINPAQFFTVADNLVAAHRLAYDALHEIDAGAQITSNAAFISGFNGLTDLFFVDRVKDKLDFVGLNYYYGFSLDNFSAIYGATGEFWRIEPQPEGIYYALRFYARRFPGLPLYIVENGMPTDNGRARDDGYTRSDHLNDSIYWVQRAKADGMNVIGYNYWSLADNYEWGSYRSRFGLYTVDVLTDPALTRRPTDAVPIYRQTVARGGVPDGYRLAKRPGSCSLVDPLSSCADPAKVDGPLAQLR